MHPKSKIGKLGSLSWSHEISAVFAIHAFLLPVLYAFLKISKSKAGYSLLSCEFDYQAEWSGHNGAIKSTASTIKYHFYCSIKV